MNIIFEIAKELNIRENQVKKVEELLLDGSTVPFISRYRKEVTGELNEVEVFKIEELLGKYNDLLKRKESIIKSLKDNGFYTDKLQKEIDRIDKIADLEDFYLPYKPKRKTRGSKAVDAGLKPLAEAILKGEKFSESKFITEDFPTDEKVISGALDIISEQINEDPTVRKSLRFNYIKNGVLSVKVVKGKTEEAAKFKDLFNYSEFISKIPSHRLLAILRGVNLGFLKVSINIDSDLAYDIAGKNYVKGVHKKIIMLAVEDGYKRLLHPSLETETKNLFKIDADEKAIDIFKKNLENLLLSPPLGEKRLLAIDPGIRTGSKVVCLDKNGKYLCNRVIKPLPPHNRVSESKDILEELIKKYKIEVITVGNGTGGREIEDFIEDLNTGLPVILTNESGASIYSASECAREEFPELDLTIRGAISIGRRLQDPLAELVKIDPKSIGVGQYQHDVDQKLLKDSLNKTVISCVNSVGVEINTASKELLSYVAGLNVKSAGNIVSYRDEHGGFKNRKEILKVKGIGAKAYEQCAGFLRVNSSKNILDKSGVHPESYWIVEDIAKKMNCSIDSLVGNKSVVEKIKISDFISEKVGKPTLIDIKNELIKPGRDPRSSFKKVEFDKKITKIDDLELGKTMQGVVTNVTAFGAFIDIGVHQDGLVHISQLSDSFVKDPNDIVKTGDTVTVKVLDVDIKSKRISLSMKI